MGARGSQDRTVSIPDYGSCPLIMSSSVLFHAVSALQSIVSIQFFWLIRSLVDPALAAFTVRGLLQFVLPNYKKKVISLPCKTLKMKIETLVLAFFFSADFACGNQRKRTNIISNEGYYAIIVYHDVRKVAKEIARKLISGL